MDNNVSNLREENSFEEKMGNLLFTLVPLALFLIVSFTTLGLLRGLAMYFVSSTLMLISWSIEIYLKDEVVNKMNKIITFIYWLLITTLSVILIFKLFNFLYWY